MKRLLATILALTLIILSPLEASDWSSTYDRLAMSIVGLSIANGACTAFSINQKYAYYLTAQHCLGDEMVLWKEPVPGLGIHGRMDVQRVVMQDKEKDVAVLQGSVGLPAVIRGPTPRKGHEVASIGYAYGEASPYIMASIISQVKEIKSYGGSRVIIIRDNVDIGGMSGGPVVDTKGRVIAMVQQINNRLSWGTIIGDIYKVTNRYWEN